MYTEPLHTRTDSYVHRFPGLQLKVVGVYQRSFSAVFHQLTPELLSQAGVPIDKLPEEIPLVVNFHTDTGALHPLSVLIPAEMLDVIALDDLLTLDGDSISFSNAIRPLTGSVTSPRYDLEFWNITADAYEHIRRIVRTLGRFSEMGRAVFNGAGDIFPDVMHLLHDAPPIETEKVLPFIGSGEGATPSGDDLISGFLLVDRHLPGSIVRLNEGFWRCARTRTTPIALWQLHFAAAGQSSIAFERLGVAAASGMLTAADVVKCIGYGFSSGTDLLCGMLARWQRELTATPTQRKE